MYKKNKSYHTPSYDTIVWKYLDFSKFVDLITNNKLFFCRSDKFEDPFEGVFRFKNPDWAESWLKRQPLTKKYSFLNCWHINDHQSDAMWKIFLDTPNGIAIKSTVGKIINSVENSRDEVNISKVYYRDLNKVKFEDLMREPQNRCLIDGKRGGIINQFNYKRLSFEHEKELRLFHVDMPVPLLIEGKNPRTPLTHKYIDVNLSELIQEVVIAPFAKTWFNDTVERLISKLNLNFPVVKSDLYKFDD